MIFALFSFLIPEGRFISGRNIETLARQGAIVAVASLGMTYVIVAGGIDLSVGSVAAFCCVVVGWFLRRGDTPVLAMTCGILAGAALGFFNGTLVTKLKVGPFIVTLGTLLIVRGLAKGLANEQKVNAPLTWLSDLLAVLPKELKWMLLPYGVWIVLLLAVIAGLVLRRTIFGRNVIAVGSNEQAARYSGINVSRTKLAVFVLSGLAAGLAGVLYFSRLTVGDPTIAVGLELDVIAAVVIGGASLSGGQGTIAGTLLGALIMTTLRAGASQYGLSNWVQEVVTGSIIVLAVGLDRLRMRGQ